MSVLRAQQAVEAGISTLNTYGAFEGSVQLLDNAIVGSMEALRVAQVSANKGITMDHDAQRHIKQLKKTMLPLKTRIGTLKRRMRELADKLGQEKLVLVDAVLKAAQDLQDKIEKEKNPQAKAVLQSTMGRYSAFMQVISAIAQHGPENYYPETVVDEAALEEAMQGWEETNLESDTGTKDGRHQAQDESEAAADNSKRSGSRPPSSGMSSRTADERHAPPQQPSSQPRSSPTWPPAGALLPRRGVSDWERDRALVPRVPTARGGGRWFGGFDPALVISGVIQLDAAGETSSSSSSIGGSTSAGGRGPAGSPSGESESGTEAGSQAVVRRRGHRPTPAEGSADLPPRKRQQLWRQAVHRVRAQRQVDTRVLRDMVPGAAHIAEVPLPRNDTVLLRQEAVRRAFQHSWRGYQRYAFGQDDLKPLSKQGTGGLCKMGLTLVDSIDTALLMALPRHFETMKDWVGEHLEFGLKEQEDINLFETTIRVMGGLLSAHDLSGEAVFLDKATDLGLHMVHAFDTPTGIPYGTLGLHSGKAYNPKWNSEASSLAEVGTL